MEIKVSGHFREIVNYAAFQSHFPLIEEMELESELDREVVVVIWSEPEFIYEYKQKYRIEDGNCRIGTPEIVMNAEFMRTSTVEAIRGNINVRVFDPSEPESLLGSYQQTVHVQPYNHWDSGHYPESLAAFCQPSDSLLKKVVQNALRYAGEEGISMSGYQQGEADLVILQAACVYKAVQVMDIRYANPPASFEEEGQKIRIPRDILQDAPYFGTCLELALLYTSALEAVGINSALVLGGGHAFAAFWKENVSYDSALVKDRDSVIHEVTAVDGKLVPVECTAFTAKEELISFEEAVSIGRRNIEGFEYLIDICAARNQNINPAFAYTDTSYGYTDGSPSDVDEVKHTGPEEDRASFPDNPDKDHQEEATDVIKKTERLDEDIPPEADDVLNTHSTKIDRLIREAMDITLRNSLINMPTSGKSFRFPFPAEQFFSEQMKRGEIDKIIRGEALKTMSRQEYDRELRKLRASDRDSRKETGIGKLYVAFSELQWRAEKEDGVHMAPLFIRPASIERTKSGNFIILCMDGKPAFNVVLREMLFQNFGIDILDVLEEGETSFEERMDLLELRIRHMDGWEVVRDIASLGRFSVPHESIWKMLGGKSVQEHDIVQGILAGAMTWDNARHVDKTGTGSGIYHLQADESQRSVIAHSEIQRAQVVMGPAGNGKTQTVINLMLNETVQGRKVLLVSEKPAAISVVTDILDEMGMKPFYLKVTNEDNNQAAVLERLRFSYDFIADKRNRRKPIPLRVDPFKDAEKKLEAFYEAMSDTDEYGNTLVSLIGELEDYRSLAVELDWEKAGEALCDEEAEICVRTFARAVSMQTGMRNELASYLINRHLTGFMREKISREIDISLEKLDILRKTSDTFARMAGIDTDGMILKERISVTYALAKYVVKCPDLGEDVDALERRLTEKLDSRINEVTGIMERMEKEPPKSHAYKADMKQLIQVLRNDWYSDTTKKLIRHPDFQSIKDAVTVGKISPSLTASETRKLKELEQAKTLIRRTGSLGSSVRMDAAEAIKKTASGEAVQIRTFAEDVLHAFDDYTDHLNTALRNTADPEKMSGFSVRFPKLMKSDLLNAWKKDGRHDGGKYDYEDAFARMREIGLEDIAVQIEKRMSEGVLNEETAITAFRKCRCRYNISRMHDLHPDIDRFTHGNYNLAIDIYKEREKALRSQMRANLVSEQILRLPDIEEGAMNNSEWGIFNKLAYKGRNSISIRTLFREAPRLITQIYPCMIMTPEAVADYVDENFPLFDMVIIDEGSQMPTYKALYPISRARSCVIFGDDRQLTPSSFFRKKIDDEDDELYHSMTAVLEDAVAVMPRRSLLYHYRSRNEGVSAFSNYRYYNNNFVTFPSNVTNPLGISCVHVSDGQYERGAGKVNEKEAEVVIKKIQEYYEKIKPDSLKTIGVITMNQPQRELIDLKLSKAVKDDEEFSLFVDDYVSILNLENCQGKEWDIVILSTVFGPDLNGVLPTNYGAIGQSGGGNRINVMITRAREEMCLVTSLTPDMLEDVKADGVQNLRDFIRYAEGNLKIDTRTSDPENSLDGVGRAAARRLVREGFRIHTNIGSSGNKVDIGIISEEDPGHYALGIILDRFKDADYNVRDREIIAPEIMEKNGWKIYRLHSINWYNDPDRETANIKSFLK